MRQKLKRLLRKPEAPAVIPPVDQYLSSSRLPWSHGYFEYKYQFIDETLRDAALLERFHSSQPLPSGYGARLDERVVEYPWLFSRLAAEPTHLLDAGSALNFSILLGHPLITAKTTVIYTLAPEPQPPYSSAQVSYVYGDLRATLLRDEWFDEIACVSTLEHVGMDNTMIYTADTNFREGAQGDYPLVLRELKRVLKPGGRLFLTVPYGLAQNLGWIQQFGAAQLDETIRAFGGQLVEKTFFRYTADGWQFATQQDCAACEYYNIHSGAPFGADYAAAARAVACIILQK